MDRYYFYTLNFKVLNKLLKSTKFYDNFCSYKIKSIQNILERDFGNILIGDIQIFDNQEKKKIVWTMWWQGIDNAPSVVKKCIESVERHIPEQYKLVIIDESNFSEYISFPSYIMEKFSSGKISKTHFSDLIRAKLLATYGGFWMDSTLFITRDLNLDDYQCWDIYTARERSTETSINVANYRWCGFIIGGNKKFFQKLDKLFDLYWKKHDILIDYFLIDYFLDLMYSKDEEFRKAIDKIPYGYNGDILKLQDPMLSREEIKQIINGDTEIYKLSYKNEISKKRIEELIKGEYDDFSSDSNI